MLHVQGTINACKELNSRIDSIREQIPGLEWEDLIQMASSAGVNLSARALLVLFVIMPTLVQCAIIIAGLSIIPVLLSRESEIRILNLSFK